MNILLVHNFYQQLGGEEPAFRDEGQLLESHGHRVHRFTVHNDSIREISSLDLARRTFWNSTVYHRIKEVVRAESIQVCHFHNTFPLISPAAYYAARSEGAAVVQTLHNYRLLCPASTFYREGRVCQDCMGRMVPWPAAVHGCYRGSRATSGIAAAMLAGHAMFNTWTKAVDRYIALTDFARDKFIEGGLPPDKLAVKWNFLDQDPGYGSGAGGYALFIGRLTNEKGIPNLLSAWEKVGTTLPLKLVGQGPLADHVGAVARRMSGVEYLGRVSDQDRDTLLGEATVLVFPSVWFEGLPRTILESFAKGTPVIAGDLGSMSKLVDHGRTGMRYQPGDAEALAKTVQWFLSHKTEVCHMRLQARQEFESLYTAERNYPKLMSIYDQAISASMYPDCITSPAVSRM